ncbi:MAG: hypothetical protein U1E51_06600 [Candidatus Binatia bacterium]|nr:hypothetical protein [Candidatus Binatia bacterium]
MKAYMRELAERLRSVRVCCGDWSRICGPSPTIKHGITGVFLDPPYADTAGRQEGIYATDSTSVSHAVREWAVEWGDHPNMRIALCGYEGEHQMPDSWECIPWKARGGYGSQGSGKGRDNAGRERIWFSPHCVHQSSLLFTEPSRPKQELAKLSELYEAGHPDREGLRLGMSDQFYQDVIEEVAKRTDAADEGAEPK